MMGKTRRDLSSMDFPERLTALRKEKGLTQRELAQAIGIHVTQLRRYEAATSQPTLDVLRRLAVVLSVSADLLLFDHDERGPGDDLRLEFEAVSRLDAKEKEVVRSVLEGILLKHEARRLLGAGSASR
jgi:transcriptional regulator with XRE-family HTH domain